MIVEKILGNLNGVEPGTRSVDRVRLAHEEMLKPHQKVTSENGRVIGISLPEGEHLHSGDILFLDDAEIVAIDLIEEEVFEIRPKNNIEWARAAFNIGNMHQRAYLYSSCIRVPYDYVLVRMLDALDIEYSREIRKLDGIPANIPAAGHRHSTSAGDSHHHHHDAPAAESHNGHDHGACGHHGDEHSH